MNYIKIHLVANLQLDEISKLAQETGTRKKLTPQSFVQFIKKTSLSSIIDRIELLT
ncbi:hypothetical protein MUP59_05765 [Candidatus Bathyarchaeota archaeon]|nr:hypothetical protein [Candidatus Bathyarchaeota archaeon]